METRHLALRTILHSLRKFQTCETPNLAITSEHLYDSVSSGARGKKQIIDLRDLNGDKQQYS